MAKTGKKSKNVKNKKDKEKMKGRKNNGITLIALVITIIVLLILAGVTIATLTGENGILTRASDASKQTEVAEEEEAIKIAYSGVLADNNGTGVSAGELQDELEKNGYSAEVTDNGNGTYTVKFESGREYTINADGSVESGNTDEEETISVTDVWYKVDGTTLHLSNQKLDEGYIVGYNGTFNGSSAITKIIIDNRVVPTSTANWFNSTYNVIEIENIENINTSYVTDMSWMFSDCRELKKLDLSMFETNSLTEVDEMFWNCTALEELYLTKMNTSNITSMNKMFEDVPATAQIYVGSNWTLTPEQTTYTGTFIVQ